MLCTLMKCVAGGGTPDLTCVLGCFGGDFSKAAEAISAFTCVISNCGSTCGGFFGGGDGGGPPPPSDSGPSGEAGGSAGGGGSGGGAGPRSIDHAWAAEEGMSLDPSVPMSFSPDALDATR